MPASILATKLYIPAPRPKVVLRPRLVERLNQGLSSGHKLILISAPAGFGKTTLVSEWAAHCGQMVAWLALDEGENDPARFLTYLVAALQTIAANIGAGALAALQSSQSPTSEPILTTLLNEIAALPDQFSLVLDDYHRIDSEPIDHALTFLLDHLPPQMHLLLTTREDPSLPLSRYRARGQLTELRATDLRFTPEEAGAFLNQMMNLNLSVENIAALESHTEGWIAGLQLAALSMQGREDNASFIKAFTGNHRFVLDFLVEEVLQRQSESIRSFLLQTAILDRFCAPLCNAVTGREDGKEMLDALERSNLFLVPLDDQRQWYRYHHLFADVLQTHWSEIQPGQTAALHQRASAWYEQNGLRTNAIQHALAAKDFERAAGLIELAWPAAEEGTIQPAAWLGWVKTLPDEMVHTRPVLAVGYAFALLGRGDLEAAQARLKDAERWLEPAGILKIPPEAHSVEIAVADQDQWQSLPAAIAVGRAYIAQALGNHQDTARYANRVLEIVPEGNHLRHGQAAMLLGMAYWASGDLEAAGRVFADYTLKLRAAGNLPDAISTAIVLADIRRALGRLHEAIETIQQCLQFVMNQGDPIPFETADLYRELSELTLEQGSLEAAAQHLQKSKEWGQKAELPVWRYRWRIAQARLNEAQGDPDGALTLLDEAERLYIRTPLSNLSPIPAMKARIWIAQGRLPQALEWAREQGVSPDDDLGFLHEYEHITLARSLIAQAQNDRKNTASIAAIRLLERLLKAAEEGHRTASVIEILVLQALAYLAQGSIKPAIAALGRALTLAEPEGYVRIFVNEGKPMAELLTRIEAKEGALHEKAYVLKLLSAFDEHKEMDPSGGSAAGKIRPQGLIIERLSDRELEVLRLLRTDLSGPEIARELRVSLNTLRTHTQNIFAKLEVNNRRAAVHRAQELNLL